MATNLTTPGKLLMKAAVPPEYHKDVEDLGDKKSLYAFLTRVAKEHPEQYVDILQNIGKISADAATYYGGPASIDIDDLEPSKALVKLREKHRKEVQSIINDNKLSDEEKRQSIVKYILPEIKKVQEALYDMDDNNSFIKQLKTGSRGSPGQIMQLLYGDMMVVDSKGNPIPMASLIGYGEGVGTPEYWAGSYGSRLGYVSVQLGTGQSGYFGKLLTQGAQRVVVTEDDCGGETAMQVKGDDAHNIGSVLQRPVAGFETGHVIEKKDLAKLKGKDIYVRSAITCQAEEGICSKCAGVRENGDFPAIGDAVGVTAARAIAEPTTQMALSVKHSGGIAGDDEKKISGFKAVSQFVNVPKNFQGGSVLSTTEGIVTRVDKAPQGGHYIMVAGQSHYVPEGVGLKVKQGDRVDAGDMLSKGMPNPAEIVQYKGIGAGRKYFVDEYTKMLEENGAGNHRRNVEAIARGVINRVKITEPTGFQGYFVGDVIPYDDLVRDYKPRKNSAVRTPVASKGAFLEQPALHYSVGTKITKKVANDLSKAGIKSIVINEEAPPFEPVMTRVMDISSTDPDWKVRLGGFNLERSFTDAATRGATSKVGDTAYVPSLAQGGELYERYKNK